MKKCTHCETNNKDTAKFCNNCGQPLYAMTTVNENQSIETSYVDIKNNLKLVIDSEIEFLIISKDELYVQFTVGGTRSKPTLIMECVSEDYVEKVRSKSQRLIELGFTKREGENYSKTFSLSEDNIPVAITVTKKIFHEVFETPLVEYEIDNGDHNVAIPISTYNHQDGKDKQITKPLTSTKRTLGSYLFWGFAILIVVGGIRQMKKDEKQDPHAKDIKAQFDPFNGSHIKVTEYIKSQMNNPSSFDHVESKYIDQGDHLVIIETYRGTNAFGGIVTNTLKAKVDMQGNIISVIEELPY